MKGMIPPQMPNKVVTTPARASPEAFTRAGGHSYKAWVANDLGGGPIGIDRLDVLEVLLIAKRHGYPPLCFSQLGPNATCRA